MTDTPARTVREAWAAGCVVRNAWLTISDAHLAELVAACGFAEAVTLDLQHGLFDQRAAVDALRAISAHSCAPLVRLPDLDAGLIGYMLDAGAAGVIAPMVERVAEAEALVAACRYPPRGRRSHGPIRTALRPGADAFAAAEQAVAFAMIETHDGLERCEELADVAGLDGLAPRSDLAQLGKAELAPPAPDTRRSLRRAKLATIPRPGEMTGPCSNLAPLDQDRRSNCGHERRQLSLIACPRFDTAIVYYKLSHGDPQAVVG